MEVIDTSKLKKTKKEYVVDNQIKGRSYSSNHAKLLKHMDRLIDLQEGKRPKPVMFHMSPCNPCNLTCSFCCFANRAMKEMLTVEQMKSAIDQFHALGATGMEFTGGGEPTLHPQLDEVIEYAYNKGLKIGICTNGSKLKKIKNWHMMSWVRLGMYSWDEKKPYPYHLEVFEGLDIEISAAYVWDGLVTALSLLGQYLLGRKKIETWWVWMLVNVLTVGLMVEKSLWLTAVLYGIFAVLSYIGLQAWRRHEQ